MEYIKEHRPAYDEWMDSYNQITGLSFEDRRDIDTRFIDEVFVDQNGNTVEVELPSRDRVGKEIKVESYVDGYDVASVMLREFESYVVKVRSNSVVIDFERMIEENEWKP